MSRFGLGWIAGSGGNDQFTKVLLHFDGANGSTTITDSAAGIGSPLSWTATGADLSTSVVKFGTASLLISSVTERISTPANAAFNSLGTTPFVFDCWINTSNSGTALGIAGIGETLGTFSWFLRRDAGNTLTFTVSGGVTRTTAGTVNSIGWHHVACIADGSNIYIALDGTVTAGASYSSLPNTSRPFIIGATEAGGGLFNNAFVGNIDEARLSIGTDRGWTNNFSPPTQAYF